MLRDFSFVSFKKNRDEVYATAPIDPWNYFGCMSIKTKKSLHTKTKGE